MNELCEINIKQAVDNNIAWCQLVSATYGKKSFTTEKVWGLHTAAPPYYPELITSSRTTTEVDMLEYLRLNHIGSVKDSFATLQLEPFGFQLLFEAEWICHPSVSELEHDADQWNIVRTITEFERWTKMTGLENSIPSGLLGIHEVKIFVLDGPDGFASFIANAADDVIGISNVCSRGIDEIELWRAIPSCSVRENFLVHLWSGMNKEALFPLPVLPAGHQLEYFESGSNIYIEGRIGMIKVKLVPHQVTYAKEMSLLTSTPEIKDSLGLNEEHTTVEGTIGFIEFIIEQEKLGKQYSRCILNEEEKLIGVITLKDIDKAKRSCHIGTWIGHPYWGKGYNQLAKAEILYTAFTELNVDYVFAGAKVDNLRSQKAQEKLPYITLFVEDDFPEVHKKLESQVNSKCILNVIEKEKFLTWHKETFCLEGE